jgi:hypothetical protein
VTAPPRPSTYRSPTAGFVNALARHTIRGLDARIRELEATQRDALELQQALATARDFADSDAAGYIDRTGLEADRA